MVSLDTTVKLNGLNQGNIQSSLIKRHLNLCIYRRSDDIYEVFYPNISKEGEVFGKYYPERESYPSNEDFGKTAWCYTNLDGAMDKFEQLVNQIN